MPHKFLEMKGKSASSLPSPQCSRFLTFCTDGKGFSRIYRDQGQDSRARVKAQYRYINRTQKLQQHGSMEATAVKMMVLSYSTWYANFSSPKPFKPDWPEKVEKLNRTSKLVCKASQTHSSLCDTSIQTKLG